MNRLQCDRLAFAAICGALLLCGVAAWLAIIMLGGCLVAALVATVAGAAIGAFAWWLHTINDREARAWLRRWRDEASGELPRARARLRHRGRR